MRKVLIAATLALALVFGVVALATADTVTYPGSLYAPGRWQASGTVTVAASVNPKITLTITTPDDPQTVDFGAVDPGVAYGPATVSLSVNSNKQFDLAKTVAGDSALIGLTTTLTDQSNVAKGSAIPFSDDYSINVPWTTDPGAYTATVTYSVVQD